MLWITSRYHNMSARVAVNVIAKCTHTRMIVFRYGVPENNHTSHKVLEYPEKRYCCSCIVYAWILTKH